MAKKRKKNFKIAKKEFQIGKKKSGQKTFPLTEDDRGLRIVIRELQSFANFSNLRD